MVTGKNRVEAIVETWRKEENWCVLLSVDERFDNRNEEKLRKRGNYGVSDIG